MMFTTKIFQILERPGTGPYIAKYHGKVSKKVVSYKRIDWHKSAVAVECKSDNSEDLVSAIP